MTDDIITKPRNEHVEGDRCRACRPGNRRKASAAHTRQLIQDIKAKHQWCPHTNTAIFVELDSDGPRGQVIDGSTYERCLNPLCRMILRYGV